MRLGRTMTWGRAMTSTPNTKPPSKSPHAVMNNLAVVLLVWAVTAVGLATGSATASADPNTCSAPYVWRNARPGDAVCVTAQTRQTVADENANPGANKQPGGGAYGPDTCAATFVWREAFPGDTICVSTAERTSTLADNAAAPSRVASAICQKWTSAGSDVALVQDNGGTILISSFKQTLGPQLIASRSGHPNDYGTASGSFNGNTMHVNLHYDNGWQGQGNLTINPDGSNSGGVQNFPPASQPDVTPTQFNWHTADKLVCDQ
jgi:hypothetical protein